MWTIILLAIVAAIIIAIMPVIILVGFPVLVIYVIHTSSKNPSPKPKNTEKRQRRYLTRSESNDWQWVNGKIDREEWLRENRRIDLLEGRSSTSYNDDQYPNVNIYSRRDGYADHEKIQKLIEDTNALLKRVQESDRRNGYY